MIFQFLLLAAGVAAGAIAAVSGFGIGSVLTPVVSTQIDTRLAVAIVSIPHFTGTLLRFVRMRRHMNRSVALTFGAASAIGGLGGAVLNAYASGPILGYVFGALLVFAGLSGITGFAERMELKGPWRWVGGFASAAFGGLVGNQGGIRSAAMLGFGMSKESFVATATAIALVVDLARVPVYLVTRRRNLSVVDHPDHCSCWRRRRYIRGCAATRPDCRTKLQTRGLLAGAWARDLHADSIWERLAFGPGGRWRIYKSPRIRFNHAH